MSIRAPKPQSNRRQPTTNVTQHTRRCRLPMVISPPLPRPHAHGTAHAPDPRWSRARCGPLLRSRTDQPWGGWHVAVAAARIPSYRRRKLVCPHPPCPRNGLTVETDDGHPTRGFSSTSCACQCLRRWGIRPLDEHAEYVALTVTDEHFVVEDDFGTTQAIAELGAPPPEFALRADGDVEAAETSRLGWILPVIVVGVCPARLLTIGPHVRDPPLGIPEGSQRKKWMMPSKGAGNFAFTHARTATLP
eukprot:scaffold74487_cov30-Tisochrysis_lutea.AAC.1